jgi:hypothetical protein
MTNTYIALITLITTNWVNFAGDMKRESGTNYIRQRLVILTNTYVEEVTLCTNRTLYRSDRGTNGPTRWLPIGPPVPGQMGKE